MLLLRIAAAIILIFFTAIILTVIIAGAAWLAPALIVYTIAVFAISCIWLYFEIRPAPIRKLDR